MTTITVNGIDFNVDIDTGFGEIEVTDINGNKVAFAEIDQNMEQGSYTVFDEDGEGEELPLPREIYNDLADGDGAEAAYWLCAISFD